MKFITILIGKFLVFALELLGRGSSYPGKVVMTIDRNFLKKIQLPKKIIAVTGSSGKSSTSYMIYQTLKQNGVSVIHNSKGSNLLDGTVSLIIKTLTLTGKTKYDVMVLEVDERYTKQIFDAIKPTHIVLTNITRDQPPRHGDYRKVYSVIESSINKEATLIVNADDPISIDLVSNFSNDKVYFGLCKNSDSEYGLLSNCLDMVYCPMCHHKLMYNYVQFGNVGDWYCSNCDNKRPKLDFEITKRSNKEIVINNKYKIGASYELLYLSYNILAAFACCSILGHDNKNIAKVLNNMELLNQRFEAFEVNNRKCEIITGKNENALTYNQGINYLKKKKELKTVVFGFEYISLRYPYQDISWLYDIDFEFLENIDKFICIGPFAYDIAARISITGIDKKDIIVVPNTLDVCDELLKTKGNIYAILNMGNEEKFKDSLRRKGIKLK